MPLVDDAPAQPTCDECGQPVTSPDFFGMCSARCWNSWCLTDRLDGDPQDDDTEDLEDGDIDDE